ncbi:MAG: ATP synthase F1 subunit gamma [Patescibacteria group bacterium]|nr:ATP synthase F1 subunit gamma [Patescibacteria group bacterium]
MNLRIIRKKIKSIANVKKITRAMQLVSAVKMKKAQQEAIEGIPYRSFLNKIILKASSLVDKTYSPLLFSHTNNGKFLFIVISSNKGLCGFFNFSIFKFITKEVNLKTSDFLVLGKKGASFINKIGGKIIADFSHINFNNAVSPIFTEAVNKFLIGEYEKVYLIYNHFINAVKFETIKTQLLPTKLETQTLNEENIKNKKEYLIEPDPKKVIEEVLKNLVEEKIRGAIIESQASEHSARMMAMKNATDNAGEIIYNLTLLRNKVRQERITNELLDMVSAKISVES